MNLSRLSQNNYLEMLIIVHYIIRLLIYIPNINSKENFFHIIIDFLFKMYLI